MAKPLVWLKRDLRWQDHAAFFHAQQRGPCVALFMIEDEWLQSPEFSPFHYNFAIRSLKELQEKLQSLGIPLLIRSGSALAVLQQLRQQNVFDEIHSHQETGLWWTFERDKKVKAWCREQGLPWHEYQGFSVFRGLNNRDLWNRKRPQIIERPLWGALQFQKASLASSATPPLKKHNGHPSTQGGRREALQLLETFLAVRGENYTREMSSPNTAYEACSRLSAHITWGTLSLKEIHHHLKRAQAELTAIQSERAKNWRRSLKSFESRLWWHCHFIQKLESEPEIEFRNMNSGYDGMREDDFNKSHFQSWTRGETGFPFVDACLRALQKEGWINFRMRAMLISFASYQLWLHWKPTATWLAQNFIDFEPGIHFSQVQMQSGVTGINTLRIYSPIKQGQDQDPQGVFIRTHCPELEGVDDKYIQEPYKMPPLIAQMSGVKLGSNYPEPIVDPKASYNEAKKKAYQWRAKPEVKKAAAEVYRKHGSRKNRFFPSQHRKAFGNWGSPSQETS